MDRRRAHAVTRAGGLEPDGRYPCLHARAVGGAGRRQRSGADGLRTWSLPLGTGVIVPGRRWYPADRQRDGLHGAHDDVHGRASRGHRGRHLSATRGRRRGPRGRLRAPPTLAANDIFTPRATVDFPLAGASVSGGALAVSGWAFDNAAVARVQVYVTKY